MRVGHFRGWWRYSAVWRSPSPCCRSSTSSCRGPTTASYSRPTSGGRSPSARWSPVPGADLAGIRAGDRIVGIDRTALSSSAQAGRILARHQIGDDVPYLVRRGRGARGSPGGPPRPTLHRQRDLLLRLPARFRLLRCHALRPAPAAGAAGRADLPSRRCPLPPFPDLPSAPGLVRLDRRSGARGGGRGAAAATGLLPALLSRLPAPDRPASVRGRTRLRPPATALAAAPGLALPPAARSSSSPRSSIGIGPASRPG